MAISVDGLFKLVGNLLIVLLRLVDDNFKVNRASRYGHISRIEFLNYFNLLTMGK
jgi:hypothetical protein